MVVTIGTQLDAAHASKRSWFDSNCETTSRCSPRWSSVVIVTYRRPEQRSCASGGSTESIHGSRFSRYASIRAGAGLPRLAALRATATVSVYERSQSALESPVAMNIAVHAPAEVPL